MSEEHYREERIGTLREQKGDRDMYTPRCRDCKAEIIWTETEKGRRMPVDNKTYDDGNIVLIPRKGNAPLAKFMSNVLEDLKTPRYKSHFATCPAAAKFRKKS